MTYSVMGLKVNLVPPGAAAKPESNHNQAKSGVRKRFKNELKMISMGCRAAA
jgi:hypothetical protein